MKIAVIGANGKSGQLIVDELINRKIDTTAVVRQTNKTKAEKVIQKDIFDLTKEDLNGFDVVIDAFGVWQEDKLSQHVTTLQHLADKLSGEKTRLLVVGGAGSLYMDSNHDKQLMDTEGFPDMFKPLASSMKQGLDEIRKRNDVLWTYVSPAADFQAEGVRTGEYLLGGEEFTLNQSGVSQISYADYAIAMVDEALNGNHIRERISVNSK